MIAIKNKENKDLSFDFDGQTYSFPKDTIVLVEEPVVEFLKELVPLAFEFDVALPKGEQVSKVKTVKTRSLFGPQPGPTQDMKVTRAGKAVSTFDVEGETSGPDYYGAGIEIDSIK